MTHKSSEDTLPHFLTIDTSTLSHTQLENLISAPRFLQIPGSYILKVTASSNFLLISPQSHSEEDYADMDTINFSLIFLSKIHKRHLFGVCLKRKFKVMDDFYPAHNLKTDF